MQRPDPQLHHPRRARRHHPFLGEHHDINEDVYTEGLDEGFYWTESDTSAGVFPTSRGTGYEPRVYSSDEPEIAQLMEVAPELFEYNW